MCGIAGIIHFNHNAVAEADIQLMLDKIAHRGPDDSGIYTKNNVGLGHVRLSIIDLSSAGHQPMYSNDQRYVLVYNGEIYNYIELKDELKANYEFSTQTDSEVIIAAYIKWGKECLDHFNGMFSFVIYDQQNKEIFAARDRFGIKPFYYYKDSEKFVFASEIPAILEVLEGRVTADEQSIYDYLVFDRTDHTSGTFFQNITKMQHGESLCIKDNKVTFQKWYILRDNLGKGFQSVDDFKSLLSSACKLRLRSDVPIGVCLSGGLDSSSIVSILSQKHGVHDLNTFSAIYGKGKKGDETKFIEEYKNLLGNMYYTTPTAESLFNDLDTFINVHAEPMPTTSPYAQFKVMELAKEHATVLLDGQGADEHLAGYSYFFGVYFKELLSKLKPFRFLKEVLQYSKIHSSTFGLKTMLYYMLPKSLQESIRIKQRGYIQKEFIAANSKKSRVLDMLYNTKSLHDNLLDHFEYKLEHLLKWEDRNSMWFSLESRVPFLDYRLVEQVLSYPNEQLIRNGMTKQVLRDAMVDMVPENIRLRKDKMGFVTPENEWFRTENFKELIFQILSSPSFKNRGYIDVDKAQNLFKKHLNGEIDISSEIWKWINLELWFRKFVDPKKKTSNSDLKEAI